ncbi:MAG: class I SAM-dependent RNA methyltransferase, partial [Parachlamydiaceae bacterium]
MENRIVHITELNEDGIGFGVITLSNNELRQVFVPYTYPGDEVEARIYRKRHKNWEGEIVRFIKESNRRANPFCPHFTVCGGCLTQQIPYSEQLEHKQQKVEKLLGSPVLPILASPLIKGYRNKMEFSFSQDKKGEKYLGLYGRRRVQNVILCPISPEWFSLALAKIRAWWDKTSLTAFNPRSGLGSLRTITFREGENSKMAILTVSGDPAYALSREHIHQYIEALSDFENISIFLRIHQAIKGQPTQFFEMHLKGQDFFSEKLAGVTFKISPAAFFQPNPRQAERLYETALSFLSPDIKVVYDLYCGTGTLSILLAKKGYEVYGIELSREACLDARENGELN